MGFQSFIDSLNDALLETKDFEGGVRSQRAHLNQLTHNLNALRDAVRVARDNVNAPDAPVAPVNPVVNMEEKKLLYLNEAGVLVAYKVTMKRAVI